MKKWTGLPRPFSHLNLGNKFFLPSCDIVFNLKSWNYLHYLCALTNVSIWNVINSNDRHSGNVENLRCHIDFFFLTEKLWSQINSVWTLFWVMAFVRFKKNSGTSKYLDTQCYVIRKLFNLPKNSVDAENDGSFDTSLTSPSSR